MASGFVSKIKKLFSAEFVYEDFFDEIEDILITSDLSPSLVVSVVQDLRNKGRNAFRNETEIIDEIKKDLREHLLVRQLNIVPDTLNVILVLGVNGVGKTTTIAKLANHFKQVYPGMKTIVAAGDTFRAAAIDQLKVHGEKLGIRIIHQEQGSDPGAVIFDAVKSAQSNNAEIIIADTAGRMHNKSNLVKELEKIDKILSQRLNITHIQKVLIIDSTTGQNGYNQAEIFHNAVSIDSAILTKYDSGSRGGTAISISKELNIPFSFIGYGEGYDDIMEMDAELFVNKLFEE